MNINRIMGLFLASASKSKLDRIKQKCYEWGGGQIIEWKVDSGSTNDISLLSH